MHTTKQGSVYSKSDQKGRFTGLTYETHRYPDTLLAVKQDDVVLWSDGQSRDEIVVQFEQSECH